MDGETRNAVASFDLIEVVRSSNRAFQITEELEGIGSAEAMAKVDDGPRARSRRSSWRRPRRSRPEFGIELVDVRFKRINYVETRPAEGLRADDLRAQAHRRAQPLRGPGPRRRDPRARRSATCWPPRSVGYKTAQELKGAADAKATAIYARAYGRDPEFYQFLKTMETLNSSLDEKTWLILSTDSELLKYLKDSGGR